MSKHGKKEKRNGQFSKKNKSKKVFVIDTNAFFNKPDVVDDLGDNIIVVPIQVVNELDLHKKRHDEKGESVREALRNLTKYKEKAKCITKDGSMRNGVDTDAGGRLYIDYFDPKSENSSGAEQLSNDDAILQVAINWSKRHKNVVMVTNDMALGLKASAHGIVSQEYKNIEAIRSVEDLYSGISEFYIPYELKEIFKKYKRYVKCEEVTKYLNIDDLHSNACCIFKYDDNYEEYYLGIYKRGAGKFDIIDKPHHKLCPCDKHKGKIWPVNIEQAFAYALLKDPDVVMITLVGNAGTGKSLISLEAGYEQLFESYAQMLVYRPTHEVSKPIGMLPGDVNEKFEPWKRPVINALKRIIIDDGNGKHDKKAKSKKKSDFLTEIVKKTGEFSRVDEYLLNKYIEILPINYLRGDDIPNTFILVDEVQNFTRHEADTVVTRIAEESKIVLIGDISQIDNPEVNSTNNGLVRIIELCKGMELYGHVSLKQSERHPLVELINKRIKELDAKSR